jgi:2-phospho-L-lactate guanylyltransferase
MKTVLLPVKDFKDAKQRLSPALSLRQRSGLARAMLSDVLRVLSAARRPERVVVFTASAEAAQMARQYNFDILEETQVKGHSAAVNQVLNELSASASHILALAADLPILRPEDVDRVFESATSAVTLVSSRDGTGTNAVLFVSPARIRMEYGEGSLQRHLASAASARLEASVLHVPGIEFDLDTPEDLRLFLSQHAPESAAWRYLRST